jgi:hypothetical protein
MSASETWTDPNQCPFCDRPIASPGEGFVRHLDESDECDEEFQVWRGRIADDIQGGWAG